MIFYIFIYLSTFLSASSEKTTKTTNERQQMDKSKENPEIQRATSAVDEVNCAKADLSNIESDTSKGSDSLCNEKNKLIFDENELSKKQQVANNSVDTNTPKTTDNAHQKKDSASKSKITNDESEYWYYYWVDKFSNDYDHVEMPSMTMYD